MATFKEAFAKARKEKGPGKTFTWNGKTYTTDRADDVRKDKAPPARPAKVEARATAKSGASRSTEGKVEVKPSPKSGAARSTEGKVVKEPVKVAGTKPKPRPTMTAAEKFKAGLRVTTADFKKE